MTAVRPGDTPVTTTRTALHHYQGLNYSDPDYLLTAFNSGRDEALCNAMRPVLNNYVPGPGKSWYENWAELNTNAPLGDCYVELQFHSNQLRQGWLYNNSQYYAFTYGRGVDQYLGYP